MTQYNTHRGVSRIIRDHRPTCADLRVIDGVFIEWGECSDRSYTGYHEELNLNRKHPKQSSKCDDHTPASSNSNSRDICGWLMKISLCEWYLALRVYEARFRHSCLLLIGRWSCTIYPLTYCVFKFKVPAFFWFDGTCISLYAKARGVLYTSICARLQIDIVYYLVHSNAFPRRCRLLSCTMSESVPRVVDVV
jgi:hypothetical protein